MARNDVYLNINALSPADAVVTGQQDMTAATVPELVLGDTPTFNFYFTDNTNVWPSWAGNTSYSLIWALSDAVAGDFSPAATTGNATPITGGWSVVLPLNSYDLVGLLNTKRVGQPYPVTNLWQQLRVTDPSGNEVTRAMFWTPVRYRAISDTQNTESASPTGGRFVTVNNVNTLTTPTAAQFYAANPVPTSALGSAANGELLIGNGTGFTKSTLTAGTGITVTNGSGSITIDATGAQETLTATVKNAESVAITKGQVVYLFGATGGFASVKLAYNTSDATSAKTFGVVSDTSIAANGTGTVTCVGVVDGLNLGAYNDGDTLYLGATPGSVTATKPYAPNHLVYVGIVERANAGNGELYVRVQNGYELDEIHDVQITAPKLAGQTLIYDQTNDLWKNARLTGTTNQITVTNADAAVTLSIPTNPTLPGNLTVSGTGTSTFGGLIKSTGTGGYVVTRRDTNADVFQWYSSTGTLQLFSYTASGDVLTIGNTGNATLGGNLTVSGGTIGTAAATNLTLNGGSSGASLVLDQGTSANATFATKGNGTFTVNHATDAGFVNVARFLSPTLTTSHSALILIGKAASSNQSAFLNYVYDTTAANTRLDFGHNGTTGQMSLTQPGNLLLKSDGIDSGNGKLQLATHTSYTGGIGFGTDQTIYRYNSTAMGLAGVTDLFIQSGNSGLWLGSAAGSYQVGIARSASSGLTFYTGSVGLAMTLDSSQHFKLTPAVASSITTTQSAPQIRMGSRASGRSNVVLDSTAGRVWSLENTGTSLTVGYSGLDAITIAETTGDATFSGVVVVGGGNASSGTLAVNYSSAVREPIAIVNSAVGGKYWYIGDGTGTSNGIFGIRSGSDAKTVFTITGAGNATFAGTITPQQAATASAPTYVKGAIYFDTTLNKLRVGGATGWETVTSA